MKKLEFCFDFGSPTTYLAWTQVGKIAEECGAELEYTPILLGGVFQATGNQTPAAVPAKGQHMFADLQRFAKRYGVELNFNPFFPVNTLQMMRGAVHLHQTEHFQPYCDAMFDAMWVNPVNMGDPTLVAEVITDAGLDAGEIAAGMQNPEVKEKLKALTASVVERGAFGAPTFFVGDEMFFGQDRLEFIREALA